MKKLKKNITAILTIAVLASTAITAHAAPAADLKNVTVHDWDTPATFAAGTSWPITTWYFYSQNGKVLGSIPNSTVKEIAKSDPSGSIEWEFWLADAFNEYRETGGRQDASQPAPSTPVKAEKEMVESAPVKPAQKEEKSPIIPSQAPQKQKAEFDADNYAQDAFDLINEAREENGLHCVEMDDYTMELAEMRVQELEESYSHVRPDGSRMSRTYYTGEIINRRANTPQIAVESWLDSPGHRDMILAERYHSAGIACWQGSDGVTYWCMLFKR